MLIGDTLNQEINIANTTNVLTIPTDLNLKDKFTFSVFQGELRAHSFGTIQAILILVQE